MDVVLREDVDSLGLRGDVVSVARGYARNFLLPRGLAEPATPGLLRELEKRDAQRARHEAKDTDEARALAARIGKLELRFDVNAGPTGTLFGSVTATNVADRLWDDEKLRIDRRKLRMETIKRVGRYTVPFEVFPEVVAEIRLVVAPEGEEPPTEEELARIEAVEEEAARAEAEAQAAAAAEAAEAVEREAAEAAERESAEQEDAESESEAAADADPGPEATADAADAADAERPADEF
jgi:large subunit ribosomal protein L9